MYELSVWKKNIWIQPATAIKRVEIESATKNISGDYCKILILNRIIGDVWYVKRQKAGKGFLIYRMQLFGKLDRLSLYA